jgi:hypothetical protein
MEKHIPDKRCLICDEVISNPICPDCINKEVRDFLAEQEMELYEDQSEYGSTRCIICGKNMSVCPSCYTNELYGIIKNLHPSLEDDFKTFFNFELGHHIIE